MTQKMKLVKDKALPNNSRFSRLLIMAQAYTLRFQ